MQLGEKDWKRLPAHLQELFERLPNHGSDEVVRTFPETTSGSRKAGEYQPQGFYANEIAKRPDGMERAMPALDGDSGSAARFFYCAKASKSDRNDGVTDKNNHPTVKPTALMQYLCRLICPPGGTVLDPFMGSGSTGRGAVNEGFNFIGIEREAAYFEIAKARIAACKPEKESEEKLEKSSEQQLSLIDMVDKIEADDDSRRKDSRPCP